MDKIKEIIDSNDFLSGRDEGYYYYLSPFLFLAVLLFYSYIIETFTEGGHIGPGSQLTYIITFFHDNFSIDTLEIIGNIILWIMIILLYLIALGSWNRFNHILEYFENDQSKLISRDYRIKYFSRAWAILLFSYSSVAIVNAVSNNFRF